RPALVIFDCDGVLVDSEPIANRIIAEALIKLGINTNSEEALENYRGGKLTKLRDRLERDLGVELGAPWVAAIYERQFAEFRASLQLIPGIVEALDALDRQGVNYCVGSNGPPDKMRVSLGVTGLYERLEGRIYSADMVPEPKPAPDLFLHAAANFDLVPEDCVVVEDSVTGVTAAVRAGMRVLGYGAESGEDSLMRAGATTTFSNMHLLPELLGCE
ncbi:MAG: HAD family hydrolase, partial [Alphaproteobacteria bacterium]|nr:HAD family hydrolase [Alphaproteobacteria bacterium]